jgi:hypothetical protein
MPLMVMPDEGKIQALFELFSSTGARENFYVELYQNNYAPANNSTLSSFTAATFPGYLSVPVARGDFSFPVIVANEGTITRTIPPIYTCTGGAGQLVYGWYMYGATSNKVYFAQQFAIPRNMTLGSSESLDPFTIKDKTYA